MRRRRQSTASASPSPTPQAPAQAPSQSNQARAARLSGAAVTPEQDSPKMPWASTFSPKAETSQEPSRTTAGQPVDLDQPTLSRHRELELLAHTVAYNGGRWDKECREFGLDQRYELAAASRQINGFEAVFATSTVPAEAPNVLAFTGSNDFDDWVANLDPQSKACAAQFGAARDAVLDFVSEAGPETTLTGHSLGGCLAQFAAVVAREQGLPVTEVVTFNAPGIPADRVRAFVKTQRGASDPVQVTHYTRAEDPVSHVGEAILPGTHVKVSTPTTAHKGKVETAHGQRFLTGAPGAEMQVQGDRATVADHDQDQADRAQLELGRRLLGTMLQELQEELGIGEAITSLAQLQGALNRAVLYVSVVLKLAELRRILSHGLSETIEAVYAIRSPALKQTIIHQVDEYRDVLEAFLGKLESEAGRRRRAEYMARIDQLRDDLFETLHMQVGEALGGDTSEALTPLDHWNVVVDSILPFTPDDVLRKGRILRLGVHGPVDLLTQIEERFRAAIAADPNLGEGTEEQRARDFEDNGGDGDYGDGGGGGEGGVD